MAGSNTRDLVSGLSKPRRGKSLPKPGKSPKPIVPTPGIGTYTAGASGGSGGGLSSPVTEKDLSTRVYYDTVTTVDSSDGLFRFSFKSLKSLSFKDAGGRDIVFVFKQDPPPEEP